MLAQTRQQFANLPPHSILKRVSQAVFGFGLDVIWAARETRSRGEPHAPSYLGEVAQRRNGGEELGPLLPSFSILSMARSKQTRPALLAPEPQHLPSAEEHALLGAIGEHLARRWNLIIPEWVNDPSRFLKRPYFTSPLEGFKALLIAESPLAFRRRLIFTEAEPLRRATMPRENPLQDSIASSEGRSAG